MGYGSIAAVAVVMAKLVRFAPQSQNIGLVHIHYAAVAVNVDTIAMSLLLVSGKLASATSSVALLCDASPRDLLVAQHKVCLLD
jgi:hypothetical protein